MRAVHLLAGAAALGALLTGCAGPDAGPADASHLRPAAPSAAPDGRLERDLAALEARSGARLGVAVLDTGTGRRFLHRADERFPSASTGKAFIAAAVLRSASREGLGQVVHYSRADLLPHAPVTSRNVAAGMTVRALVDAMLRASDNTAANLLVRRLGGPQAVQRFLRSIGDPVTSVDRVEPALNTATPGDRRDTTTAAAAAHDLERLLLGSALPVDRRALLEAGMRGSTTGDAAIRAGVPASWVVADRTGTASSGVRDDIAVLRPPGHAPVVLVLLTRQHGAPEDALLADATRAVVTALAS